MGKPTTSGAGTSVLASQSATPSSTHQASSNNKLAIIIVAAVGGVIFIVALVLIIVPFARRRATRRKNKQAEGSSSSDVTTLTGNSRREVHNRTLSVDASVPLLEPDSSTSGPEYSRFGTLGNLTAQPDTYTHSSSPPTPSTNTSFHSPRLFAPTFSSFTARPPLPDSEPGLPVRSRFTRSAPQQPLRHTRARIGRVPMDTLPEDRPTATAPPRSPSPIATRTGPRTPAPAPAPILSPSPPPSPPPLHSPVSSRASTSTSVSTSAAAAVPSPPPAPPSSNWLHIPKTGPLISAFRQSISSVASRGSSLPTMQHYPSFSQSQNVHSASASTRSSQTFYSVVSASNGAPPSPTPPPPVPSEHGELTRPPVPRLKPSGTGERVPQVHLNAPDGHHAASRQASMVNPASAVPGKLRSGSKSRPVSSTVGSGSSLSLYVDARSQIGGTGDDGKWNGSGNGSVGGSSARGRQRS